jgi:hypothetical protein
MKEVESPSPQYPLKRRGEGLGRLVLWRRK